MKLVFDDEPLERILYGENVQGPTSADVFVPVKGIMYEIRRSSTEQNVSTLARQITQLLDSELAISFSIYRELLNILYPFIPQDPNPHLKHELTSLGSVLQRIWNFSLSREDRSLQNAAGSLLYRCYEHCHLYSEARTVLQELIQIQIKFHDKSREAVYKNNLAFEYLFERQWKRAAPLFKDAAEIFFKLQETFNWANARANFWTCSVEFADFEEIDSAEGELESIAEILRKNRNWRERKPLIVLARIQERRGNLERAASLVEQAISSAKESETKWPEIDQLYWKELKAKLQDS